MIPNDGLNIPGSASPSVGAQPTLNGAPVAVPRPRQQSEPAAVKDAFREVVETIVFVIVLVLLLKTFVAEAFVIPTGSMAETLLGYQKWVTCVQCGYEFPVNCSNEVDPQQGPPMPITACTCPNCRFKEIWLDHDPLNGGQRAIAGATSPSPGSGDRVLVSKFPFDNGNFGSYGQPKRLDVVVFKYPEDPQKHQTPMNYIKRLVGLPGETIAIYNGDIYVSPPGAIDYPLDTHSHPDDPKDLWRLPYTYSTPSDPTAMAAFIGWRFKILSKSPEHILAMRRIVYDNDFQAADLIATKAPPRWLLEGDWLPNKVEAPKEFRQIGNSGNDVQWLHYRHLLVERNNIHKLEGTPAPTPQVIRNYMGYNTGETANGPGHRIETNWVGDLIVECTAKVETLQGELILELSKAAERFQARFDLQDGTCALWRMGAEPKELARSARIIAKPGTYALRFANVDDRLTVWVDGKLPFQDKVDAAKGGVDYDATSLKNDDIEHPNNYQPASIGVRGGAKLTITHLQLWRDTYYTPWTDKISSNTEARTLYVQPGHYLCLGDNSSESSDSRYWGLVPERLLLGRALLVYYPFTHSRTGLIR